MNKNSQAKQSSRYLQQTLWVAALFLFSAGVAQANLANNQNSVMVTLTAGSSPADLNLSMNGTPISVIDFPKDKKFIQFAFPPGYSNFDIRVFEMNEVNEKNAIMVLYQSNPEAAVKAFDALWRGKASSQQRGHEFNLRNPQKQNMVLQNLNRDGTAQGTMHDYILKFTVDGKTYLQDPQIRNKD
jgi:hypothetical protein